MPPTPFETFIDNLRKSLEKSAEDLLKDLNREATRSMRDMVRATRQTNKPLPKPGKRGQKASGEANRPDPTPVRRMTLYDALEVSPVASQETISAAFRSLSQRFHPDNKTTGNAAVYKNITAAWSVLKNPEKRANYDRRIGLK